MSKANYTFKPGADEDHPFGIYRNDKFVGQVRTRTVAEEISKSVGFKEKAIKALKDLKAKDKTFNDDDAFQSAYRLAIDAVKSL